MFVRLQPFAVALSIFLIAVAGRLGLDMVLPERAPFITFFPAVAAAAYFCGLGPALLVLALTVPATWLVWGEQAITTKIFGTAVFTIFAGAILIVIEHLHQARRALEARDRQLQIINREQQHRFKNLFAVTSSVCIQTVRRGLPMQETIAAISGRIGSLAAAQELLSATASDGADLNSLLVSLVHPLAPTPDRLRISGPSVRLRAEDSTPLALVLHELATNALKYGAWAGAGGAVSVSWQSPEPGRLALIWSERYGPPPATDPRPGLGTRLITQALPHAKVKFELKPTGLEARIDLPCHSGPATDERH